MLPFKTLDDVELSEQRVLLRVDMNCSVDPSTKRIMDTSRIAAVTPTLRELKDSKVVIMAHQGRPGSDDYISLAQHAEILRTMGFKAKYVDDIFGEKAKRAISKVRTGEILLLENVRFFDGENKTGPPEEMVKEPIVQELYPLFDLFVNDAFGAAHRSQPSIVGFTCVLPSVAGRVMEKEIRVLSEIMGKDKHPWTLVLGGSKVEDKIKTMGKLLGSGRVDHALLGGLIANVFLIAAGVIPESYGASVSGIESILPEAKALLDKHAEVIRLPEDVAVERDGRRVDCELTHVGGSPIFDIGPRTIHTFVKIAESSAVAFANGPMGYFEKEQFQTGTARLIEAIARSNCISVVGGGHVSAMAGRMGLADKLTHISTGGGATINFLTGKKLELVDALERAAKRMG